jgi:hypothetical protein
MATLATVAIVAVKAFEIAALADTADFPVAAFLATTAAVAVVAVAVHALPVATRFVEAADIATGAAIVAVGLQIIDALVVVAAPRPVTLQNAIDLCADAWATVAAGAAVIRVEAQVVNARPVATLAERGAADFAAELVAFRAGNTLSFSADFVGGAGGPTGGAVVAARLEIDACAIATRLVGGADRVAGATVPLVDVQVKAFAAALVAPVLAPAIAVLAFGAGAAIIILIAVLPHLLAGCCCFVTAQSHECRAEGAAKESFERAAARNANNPRQGIESWCVHGRCPFVPAREGDVLHTSAPIV